MAEFESQQNGEPNDEHPAMGIETIGVDPDDIMEMMRRNERDRDEQRSHCLRINPPFEGAVEATLHVSQDHTFYPSDMDPKPIHLGEALFIGGHSMDRSRIPTSCRYPDRNDSMVRFREEFDVYGENGDTRPFTDDEEAEWDKWWNQELEFWEGEVRNELVDEATLTFNETVAYGTIKTTVNIRYDER